MKTIVTFIFLLLPLAGHAQAIKSPQPDSVTYYLNKNNFPTTVKDSAVTIRVVIEPHVGERYYTIHDYFSNGKIKAIAQSTLPYGRNLQGKRTEYFINGKQKNVQLFDNGKPLGSFYAFYPDGKPYLTGEINNYGALIIDECYDRNGQSTAIGGSGEAIYYDSDCVIIIDNGPIEGGVKHGTWKHYEHGEVTKETKFTNGIKVVSDPYRFDKEAEFKGGLEGFYRLLGSNIRFTAEAKNAGLTGKIFAKFIVEADGSVSNVKIMRGVGYGMDEEVIRVIKLSSKLWNPAMRDDEPVASEHLVPISVGK